MNAYPPVFRGDGPNDKRQAFNGRAKLDWNGIDNYVPVILNLSSLQDDQKKLILLDYVIPVALQWFQFLHLLGPKLSSARLLYSSAG
ncbi:unnamed protein product [Leptosia nina]|uniref:Uncharacterized protein n=1 Tax=Leptosia nina TaxID=320188 RepID=A0AAV1JZ42_9NEOP